MDQVMDDAPIARLHMAAAEAAKLLKSLANEDRLLLLCQMVNGERSVGELEEATGVRQPTLSQQLGVLRQAGLVATRRDGKRILYSLASREVERVLAVLYDIYCPAPVAGDAGQEERQ